MRCVFLKVLLRERLLPGEFVCRREVLQGGLYAANSHLAMKGYR